MVAISMKGRTQAETAIITNEKITKNKSTTENANSNRRNFDRVDLKISNQVRN